MEAAKILSSQTMKAKFTVKRYKGFKVVFNPDFQNVVDLEKESEPEKQPKLTKDGRVKKTRCNKKKGDDSEVYAFRTDEEINAMLDVFDKKIDNAIGFSMQERIAYRNKLLFYIGINVGLRASDLCQLKWSSFFVEEDGEYVFKSMEKITPQKTRKYGKTVKMLLNEGVKEAIMEYLFYYPIENIDDYIFFSRKGDKPLTTSMMCKIIKDTAKLAGIKQNIGSHSLRKTFGYRTYHMMDDKENALILLQKTFNHEKRQTTMDYIGITDEERQKMVDTISFYRKRN